jgi:hypothetical protein
VLWFSGSAGNQAVGWFDVNKYEATHDEQGRARLGALHHRHERQRQA